MRSSPSKAARRVLNAARAAAQNQRAHRRNGSCDPDGEDTSLRNPNPSAMREPVGTATLLTRWGRRGPRVECGGRVRAHVSPEKLGPETCERGRTRQHPPVAACACVRGAWSRCEASTGRVRTRVRAVCGPGCKPASTQGTDTGHTNLLVSGPRGGSPRRPHAAHFDIPLGRLPHREDATSLRVEGARVEDGAVLILPVVLLRVVRHDDLQPPPKKSD